jgi:hypothetical protein
MEKSMYKIHDNGGRPFKCIVEGNIIKIYNNYKKKEEHFLQFEFEKIFIGKSPLNSMTAFSGGHGSGFDGNSILIKLNNLIYVSIGYEIYSFEAMCEIVDYVSPVGNSDVPYPYAIDCNQNYYLTIEDVIIENNKDFAEYMKNTNHDPYNYYYFDKKPIEIIPPYSSKIKSFTIGTTKSKFSYSPDPGSTFDRLTEKKKKKEMKIVFENRESLIMGKEKYIEIMELVGQDNHLRPIKNKIMIQERL